MRHSLTALLTVAVMSSVAPAWAGDCAQPYTSDNLLADLATVESAAQSDDSSTAMNTAMKLESGLDCLDEKLVTMLLSRTYRSIGAGYLVGGSETRARSWLRTALELDRNFEFGLQEYGEDHPIRTVFTELKMQPEGSAAAVDGKALVDGKFYLDGSRLESAEAVPGRPHLLQKVGDGVESWVIQGNTFPDEVLVDPAAAAASSEGPTKDKKNKSKTRAAKAPTAPEGTYGRVRPPEKTPLMIAGGALIAGAGGMFVGSILSRQAFDEISDDEEALRKAQNTTNRLYLGSFAVLAVGGGVLTWGIVLDGNTPMPAVRVRF